MAADEIKSLTVYVESIYPLHAHVMQLLPLDKRLFVSVWFQFTKTDIFFLFRKDYIESSFSRNHITLVLLFWRVLSFSQLLTFALA